MTWGAWGPGAVVIWRRMQDDACRALPGLGRGRGNVGRIVALDRIGTVPRFAVPAMTALSRLIILQGKEGDPSILLCESGAILLIAVACWTINRVQSRD